jgi:2-polyprenyl-6-methoxyphenol hydroxylase-like FAD-dependent oxidoreductase
MHVLISGAGIAGSTAAWFLAKAGARVTVVEKAHELLPHGQSVDVNGSAISVIKKMGLFEEIRRRHTTEAGTIFIDSKTRQFAPLPAGPKGLSPTSEFEILRGDLAKILYEAARSFANVEYRFDTTIKEVTSNSDDSVEVILSNGSKESFNVLITADGQWSKIRKQVFPEDAVTVNDRGMYATYWTIPRTSEDNDWWSIYQALDSRIVTIRPDPYGTMRAMFTCLPRDNARTQAWEDAARGGRIAQEKLLQQEFSSAGWYSKRFLNGLADAPDFYFQSIKQIVMQKWHSGRVICLGDTAYCPTPTSGMGTTIAIMGAYTLAGELSKLKPNQHPVAAFEEHERVLRPIVNELGPLPKFILKVVHADAAWKRWLFQSAISLFSKIVTMPWLAKRMGQPGEAEFILPNYESREKVSA